MATKKVLPESVEDLLCILTAHGIDPSKYGQGKAKTVERLFEEVSSNECSLVGDEVGLVRVTHVAGVELVHSHKTHGSLILREACQVFRDFREEPVRLRPELETSVSEKFKDGEDPMQAAIRGCEEELGVCIQLTPIGGKEERKESPSYPGLPTVYKFYFFQGVITEEDFSTLYSEESREKFTVFTWVPQESGL